MFTRLIVALDRSHRAERCIDMAVAIARAADADLDLVCVTEPQSLPDLQVTSDSVSAILAEEYLRNVADRVISEGMERVHHAALDGHPAEALSAYAKRTKADLLIVASHGRTGVSRAWTPSLADELVRRAGIPVLVLRDARGKSDPSAPDATIRRILVTLDGSQLAEAVLTPAITLAASLGAELHLLRVVQPVQSAVASLFTATDAPDLGLEVSNPAALTDTAADAERVREATSALDECMHTIARTHEIVVFAHVIRNADVARAVLEFSATHGIDLIALGSRGRGLSRLVIGSVADKILRNSELPILTLHSDHLELILPRLTDGEVLNQLPAYCGL